jgi:hypothetical protein
VMTSHKFRAQAYLPWAFWGGEKFAEEEDEHRFTPGTEFVLTHTEDGPALGAKEAVGRRARALLVAICERLRPGGRAHSLSPLQNANVRNTNIGGERIPGRWH